MQKSCSLLKNGFFITEYIDIKSKISSGTTLFVILIPTFASKTHGVEGALNTNKIYLDSIIHSLTSHIRGERVYHLEESAK